MAEEKKTDWGGIALIGAVVVGAYLLTRPVEAKPTPPTIPVGPIVVDMTPPPPGEPSTYTPGTGHQVNTPTELSAKLGQPWTVGESQPKQWQDPTQAPLFHFSLYPGNVPLQSGQVVGVGISRPWAGVQGDALFQKATEAPLYWSGPPETADLILVPERYRAIIEKYGVATLRDMRSPANPAYAEIEKQYGRETANLMIRYALELSNGLGRGYKIEYVTQQHMRTLANIVDERFVDDWILGTSVTHPQEDPAIVGTRASQMHLTVDQYKYIALKYFYEVHGYIPDKYKVLWATLDPQFHDSWRGFPPAALPKTYTAPSGSGITYTLEEYQKIFGTVPWDKPLPWVYRNGKQTYVWRDPLQPGSILIGTMDDYKKSMAEAEKKKGPTPAEIKVAAAAPSLRPMEVKLVAGKPPIPAPGAIQPQVIPAAKRAEVAERLAPPKSTATVTPAKPLEPVTPPAPVSKPADPMQANYDKVRDAYSGLAKSLQASQVVTETLQKINKAAPGPRRG